MLGHLFSFNRPLAVKILNKLLAYGLDNDYPDLYLTWPRQGELHVKYKQGQRFIDGPPLDRQTAEAVWQRAQHLAGLGRQSASGQFVNEKVKVAAALIKTDREQILRLQISPLSLPLFYLDELGLSPTQLAALSDNLCRPGLIVISSPPGHGKTTTGLACALAGLAEEFNVYTLSQGELPVLAGANQLTLVKTSDWQRSFQAVRHQNPDLILIDQPPRDWSLGDVAALSLSANVILTLTADSQNATWQILNDAGLTQTAAEINFRLFLHERLARRLCSACRFSYNLNQDVFTDLAKNFDMSAADLVGLQLWHAHGCPDCSHQGHRGHIGLFELAAITPEFGRELRLDQNSKLSEISDGSLAEDALFKALAGQVTVEELKRAL